MRGLALCTLLVLGCRGVDHPVPRDVEGGRPPLVAWQRLLVDAISDEGVLDMSVLRSRRRPLDRMVAWLAEPRPMRVQRAVGRQAFYLTALDVLVLHAALRRWGDGPLPDDPWAVVHRDTGVVDGHRITLGDLDQHLVRARLQDHRHAAAAHRLQAADPPWRRAVWREESVDAALDEAMRDWLNDPGRGARATPEGIEVPVALADRAWDARFQTGGDDLCTVVARHGREALRLDAMAEGARGCRWSTRQDTAPTLRWR